MGVFLRFQAALAMTESAAGAGILLNTSMSNFLKKVPLERLVESSELVIVARPAEPPARQEPIDIAPPGSEPSAAFPPFIRVRRRFVVEEILQAKGDKRPPPVGVTRAAIPALGDVIEVDSASHDYDLGVHRKRYVENVHKITIHERYDPEDLPEKLSSSRLVFLRHRGEGWSFAFDSGEEGLGHRARVEKVLEEIE
jgi:hypothetical protein